MGRLRLKAGNAELEIEVEGDDFSTSLPQAVDALERLARAKPAPESKAESGSEGEIGVGSADRPEAGINTIVARFGAGSARAILRAAAIHLSLVDGLAVFSRDAWGKRAREARDWQVGYGVNQSRDIKRMIDAGEIVEKSATTYALPSVALEEAKRALADV